MDIDIRDRLYRHILAEQPRKSFTGYSEPKKGHRFRSDKTYHEALSSPAPLEQWLDDSPSEITSGWRQEFHIYLEVSLSIKGYQMCPVSIPFVDRKGMRCEYQPLCILHYWTDGTTPKDVRSMLVDIRSDSDIRADADWFIPAWQTAHRFAQYKRLKFKVFRDKFFLSDYFHNVKFTSDYRWLEMNEADWLSIDSIVAKRKNIKVEDLLDSGAGNNDDHCLRLERSVWTLVSKGCLGANWNRKFTLNTELYSNW